jgi:hypothetical protein
MEAARLGAEQAKATQASTVKKTAKEFKSTELVESSDEDSSEDDQLEDGASEMVVEHESPAATLEEVVTPRPIPSRVEPPTGLSSSIHAPRSEILTPTPSGQQQAAVLPDGKAGHQQGGQIDLFPGAIALLNDGPAEQAMVENGAFFLDLCLGPGFLKNEVKHFWVPKKGGPHYHPEDWGLRLNKAFEGVAGRHGLELNTFMVQLYNDTKMEGPTYLVTINPAANRALTTPLVKKILGHSALLKATGIYPVTLINMTQTCLIA